MLRMVRSLFSTTTQQNNWLLALGQQALIGSTTGIADVLSHLQDWGASGVSNEGSSTQWLRSIDNATIASLCEAAIQVIEADGDTPGSSPSSYVSHGNFGNREVRLG